MLLCTVGSVIIYDNCSGWNDSDAHGLGCITSHWHQPEHPTGLYQNAVMHCTVMRVLPWAMITSGWNDDDALGFGCVTAHWHQQQHQGLSCHSTLTPATTPRFKLCHIHWHQQQQQCLCCVTAHWHQQQHQGLSCHNTLTPTTTPRLGLCHSTLTPAATPRLQWNVGH